MATKEGCKITYTYTRHVSYPEGTLNHTYGVEINDSKIYLKSSIQLALDQLAIDVPNLVQVTMIEPVSLPISDITYCSPFIPTDIANLLVWFDAKDVLTITKDVNNQVSEWKDKSGNDDHAVQTTLGRQVEYRELLSTYQQGGPGIYCDGGYNKVMTFNLDLLTTDLYTLFVVCEADSGITDPTAIPVANGIICGSTVNNSDSFIGIRQTSATPDELRTVAQAEGYTQLTGNNQALIGYTWDGTYVETYYNGVSVEKATASVTTQTVEDGYIFSDSSEERAFIGTIYEVVLYKSVLTAEELTSIQDYLKCKWNLE